MYLQSLANKVPETSFTQNELWNAFRDSESAKRLRSRSVDLVKRVILGENGIAKRHFALSQIPQLFDLDAESLNHAFEIEAPALAQMALKEALEKAHLLPDDIDALFVCTCTGYICPGITSHVAEKTGMRSDAYLQDIVGLGCGAAIPTLQSASNFLKAYPDCKAAVIAVEICSAAFYMDDNPGVIISACLFGDGASASIWTGKGLNGAIWRAHSFQQLHQPREREILRFVNKDGKLRNQLTKAVPEKAAKAVEQLYKSAGEPAIERVISHTGGRDVIEAVRSNLPDSDLKESTDVLSAYGNLSSPSVLFSLERCLENNGHHKELWMTAFGAGFSAYACRLSAV